MLKLYTSLIAVCLMLSGSPTIGKPTNDRPVIGQLPKFTNGIPAACFISPVERDKTGGPYLQYGQNVMIIDGQRLELTEVNPNNKWGPVKFKSGDYNIQLVFRSPIDPYLWLLNLPGKAKLKVTHKGKTTVVKGLYWCMI